MRTYLKINEKSIRWLWVIVILGLLATLPIVYERVQTERTARQVEFVFDYRDLLDISEYKPEPMQFVAEQLVKMKAAGIFSMAVYESTLNELRQSRHLDVFSTRDIQLMSQTSQSFEENYTYVLFKDNVIASELKPMIQRGFTLLGIPTQLWSYHDQEGLMIEMAVEDAIMKPLDPDPITMDRLKSAGFHIVVRLSNRIQPFSPSYMEDLLSRLHDQGVRRLITDGPVVPGFSYTDSLQEDIKVMGELLNKYEMGIAAIEMLKEQQRGFSTLARELHYNVVRLHSFTERDGEKLAGNLTEDEREQLVQTVADRFVLAVKDRNIRIIFLNAKPIKNVDKGIFTDALDPLYDSLQGKDGAVNRVLREGFTLGPSKQLALVHSGWQKLAKAVLLVASIALISIAISYFFRPFMLASFAIGLVGSAGLYVLSSSLYGQATALAVGISAATIAVIAVIRATDRAKATGVGSRILISLRLFIQASLISLIGVVFIIGLLNNITYFLVLEQFRGVSALHLVPAALVAVYLLFFRDATNFKSLFTQVRVLFSMNIRVWWVVVAAIALIGGNYYLSRTGNSGQTTIFEVLFRSFLENTLGVRPRIKEFLFAHPLFLFGAYLAVKYRNAVYLFIAGVIGQLSIIDTFAHLHTPVVISSIRVFYGMVFGIIVGLLLILVWEILAKGWRKWIITERKL